MFPYANGASHRHDTQPSRIGAGARTVAGVMVSNSAPNRSRYREVPSNHEEHQNQIGYQNDGTHRDAVIDAPTCLHNRTYAFIV